MENIFVYFFSSNQMAFRVIWDEYPVNSLDELLFDFFFKTGSILFETQKNTYLIPGLSDFKAKQVFFT